MFRKPCVHDFGEVRYMNLPEAVHSRQIVSEAEHDFVDVIAELNECWENRLSLDNPRLAERYLNLRCKRRV